MQVDALILAGDASCELETKGFVACGRRKDGETYVDFWTRQGKTFRYVVTDTDKSVDDVVTGCLALVQTESLRLVPTKVDA